MSDQKPQQRALELTPAISARVEKLLLSQADGLTARAKLEAQRDQLDDAIVELEAQLRTEQANVVGVIRQLYEVELPVEGWGVRRGEGGRLFLVWGAPAEAGE